MTRDSLTILHPDFEGPFVPGSFLILTIKADQSVYRVRASIDSVGENTIRLRHPGTFHVTPERRRALRTELRIGAEYRRVEKPSSSTPSFLSEEDTRPAGPWTACRIEDLSETGARLKAEEEIEVGSLLYVRLSLPFLGTAVLLSRAVRASSDDRTWTYGVSFEWVSDGDRVRIAEYAASQRSPQGPAKK